MINSNSIDLTIFREFGSFKQNFLDLHLLFVLVGLFSWQLNSTHFRCTQTRWVIHCLKLGLNWFSWCSFWRRPILLLRDQYLRLDLLRSYQIVRAISSKYRFNLNSYRLYPSVVTLPRFRFLIVPHLQFCWCWNLIRHCLLVTGYEWCLSLTLEFKYL